MTAPALDGTLRTAPTFVIAIDGPAGTGKSTIARSVAVALGAGYLDTGAMYRIVSLAVLDAGIDPTDPAGVAELLPRLTFDMPTDPAGQRHVLAGRDVSDEIRGQDVTLAVTPVSANPAVRAWLLGRQREMAYSGRMVVEGRDIGTVVTPDAPLKIYLTADATERARRRHRQNTLRAGVPAGRTGESRDHLDATAGDPDGNPDDSGSAAADLAAVALDLHRRDSHDSTRQHAPLQAAQDAVVIDSSELAVDETVECVLTLASERGIR
ncbi:MAG TPA: (d)CMP kinase [Nakamurella sp.]|nr:(d)CMP kinase [Nakamurella sp.]